MQVKIVLKKYTMYVYGMVFTMRDVYELNNGKPTIKSKGTDAYCKLLSYFDGILEDYTLTAENKNIIKIDEKRIFAPSFIFVRKGNA